LKILVTNDDGIYSSGIFSLWNIAKEFGDINVIAPISEKSAVGHGITISKPLYVKQIERNNGFKGLAVSGTPADCVKIGVKSLLASSPDLILSGINIGSNLGNNIIYSGTVAAAIEGATLNIPSIAISIDSFRPRNFSTSKIVVRKIMNYIKNNTIPARTILNINIPDCEPNDLKGYKITVQGNQYFNDNFDKRTDPSGRDYYWMTGEIIDNDSELKYDGFAVSNGFASITPIHYMMTNTSFLDELEESIN
jgi:5'-nucleotidase